ncbi:unnamed protein product, partial [Prorocentrum cordatum]
SMSWVNISVREALEACQYQMYGELSRVVTRAYVDAAAQNIAGQEHGLQAHLLPAAIRFAREVERLGLTLST